MKHTLRGWYCVCLLIYGMSPGRAQEQPPAEQPGQQQPGPQIPKPPEPPPLPPRPPDVKMPDEGRISIGIWGWLPTGNPIYDKGKLAASTEASHLRFAGKPKLGRGVILSLPAGGHNAIRISYFDTKASGNVNAPTDLNLWSTGFTAGDYLSTNYRLRGGKFSYEFLTWPYPIGSRRFRLKTLWQVQYAKIESTFNAPLSTTETSVATGSKTVILPTLGLGITEYFSRNVHFDANASGFTLPHRAALGDVDASLSFRFSKLELQAGGKMYYFKTSPKGDFYMKGMLTGAFVGLKFYLN